MNILWLVLALTQRWYYLIPLYIFVNATDSIIYHFSDVTNAICSLPASSSTYICRKIASHRNETAAYVSSVDKGYTSLSELLFSAVRPSIENGLAGAHLSIDDAIFLTKSSKMDCREGMVTAFEQLEVEARVISGDLVAFRAKVSGAVDLVASASTNLLDLISNDNSASLSSFRSTVCAIGGNRWSLRTCASSHSNILQAFNYTISKFESIVDALLVDADKLDLELGSLETILRVIRDLLADEAGSVQTARDDIISSPWHFLGWNSRELLRYGHRIQAIYDIKVYRNAATTYVSGIRGRLRSVAEELAVLKVLADEPAKAREILSMKTFMQTLQAGILRLHQAQVDMLGMGGEKKMIDKSSR